MKSKFFIIIAGFLFITSTPAMSGPVTVTDMAGRTVTLPARPERIIGLGPGALRLIVYLEAQDKVCGVEEMEKLNPRGRPYWMAHPELARLFRCGPGGPASINKKPDMEAVLAVSPQVIFITYMEAALADEVSKTLGIPVVVLSYGAFATFDTTVYDAFRIMGKILGKEDRAESVIRFIEAGRLDLDARTRTAPEGGRPRAYIGGVGYKQAYGLESTEQRHIPLEWVHAVNLAESLPAAAGSHVFAGKEQLLGLDPDVIFIDAAGKALLAQDKKKQPAFYKSLKAFRSGRVFVLYPFNSYTTNIGTAIADAYAIGKILYPERFTDIDPEQKAGEIYRFLLGRDIYPEMKKDYGNLGAKLEGLPE